jgi:hypothetical protein
VTDPWGETQAAEEVGDEHEVPKANGFAKGESIAHQMFSVGSDVDCR